MTRRSEREVTRATFILHLHLEQDGESGFWRGAIKEVDGRGALRGSFETALGLARLLNNRLRLLAGVALPLGVCPGKDGP